MDYLPPMHARLFRTLLYFYPAAFRHEYGAEMEQLFADRLQTEPRFRLWLETLADIARTGPKEHWHVLASDVKYGARVLSAAPGFTATALAVIALGIGATVSIFSIVNAVLVRSLPYGHPEQLVYLWSPNPTLKGTPAEMAPNIPDYYEWRRLSHSFASVTMLRQSAMNLVENGSTRRIQTALVTPTFFGTLEAWPIAGRAFDGTGTQEAIISESLWRAQFQSNPAVIGTRIQLNRDRYTVIGIMPKDFGYPFNGDIPYTMSEFKHTDIWLPLICTAAQKTDRVNFLSADAAIARLLPGASPARAQAELIAIQSRLNPLYPETWRGWTALVVPLIQTIVGPVEKLLWLLLGAVALVLLIAISNAAHLLLARALARAHEFGIRTALGAERGRIIRQLLTESLMLSCTGGAGGVAIAYVAVHLLVRLNPGDIPRFDTAGVDARVLIVAVLLSIALGVLAGLAPAYSVSRFSINALLRAGGNRVGGTSNKSRFALIVFEVALSVILLTGSGLLIRSYLQLMAVDPGFAPATLTFILGLDDHYNTPQLRSSIETRLMEKLRAIPGVQQVGASSSMPLSHSESLTFAEIQGWGKSESMLEIRSATPGYRSALGTPLLRGRDLTAHDVDAKPPVVLVNQAFAKAFLHGRNPIGGQVRLGIEDSPNRPWSTIVGMMGDIHHTSLEEASQPQVFEPRAGGNNFAIQFHGPVEPVIAQSRAALRQLDPALTLDGIHTMRERIEASNAHRSFQTALMTGFAAVAIALTLVGIYGLMSYSVKRRTAEIGIRMAVGSSRTRVVALILSQGLRLTGYGLLIGLTGAFALTRLVSSWLYGVKANDPITFIAVPSFMLLVASCACLVPAWSATRIDPVQALRQD